MQDKIELFSKRLEEINKDLADPATSSNPAKYKELSQEYSDLEAKLKPLQEFESIKKQISEAEEMVASETDEEMRMVAEEELGTLKEKELLLAKDVEEALLPSDPDENKDVIMEIRAGAGGDEAGLFATDLFRMYSRFAEDKGWKIEIMNSHKSGVGGFKEIIFAVRGEKVYKDLRHESGVHRVQRIPETEKNGRIHTSTVTVAVLPEVEDVEFEIKLEDVRLDVFRSSGPGGQSVNTTDSAVRLTHVPTGIVVTCQDEKSQHKNRDKAMKVLRSRLKASEEEKHAEEEGSKRRAQIGTGDRSEKIRTYNIPQDRITDHRIKKTMHDVEKYLGGDISEMLEAVKEEFKKQRLTDK
ncbi:MAG: peptide chain release factor 1 [bacterium]